MSKQEGYLINTRSLVIFTLAIVVGLVVGGLTGLAGESVPAAVLAGMFAAGGTLVAANSLVAP